MDPATIPLTPAAAETPVRPRAAWVKRALMYGFAAACLVWVFHDVHPRHLLASMRVGNWWLLAAAIVVDILTYLLQGVRWKILLSPVGRLGSVRATQAIYAGLFTNELMPLRLGELVRAVLASRWLSRNEDSQRQAARTASGVWAVLPSMVVERFLDALWLAAGTGLAALFVRLPRNLLEAGDVLGLIVLGATGGFLWIVWRREKELERETEPVISSSRPVVAARSMVSRFAGGLRQIGISRRLYLAAAISAGMLVCQVLAVWFMMRACDLSLPLGAGAVVFLVVRLGTAIPNAPANVGSFQFFTVLALGLFGIDKTTAAAFSIVDFAALTAPLWLIGLMAIAGTGMSWSAMRAEASRMRARGPSLISH